MNKENRIVFHEGLMKLIMVSCVLIWFTGCQTKIAERPNIVFFLSDDHAVNAISVYGSQLIQTPNIDRLASEGMRFDQCFAVEAICRPSRTSILTGKYGHITGGTGWDMYDTAAHRGFPEIMQTAGYQTALFGKFHIGSTPIGFDSYAILPGQGRYNNPELLFPEGKRTIEGHISDIVVDLAIDWLEKENTEAPFLLCINDKAIHMPFLPAERWMDAFEDAEIAEPTSLFYDIEHPDHPLSLCDITIDSLPHWQEKIWGKTPENLGDREKRQWIYNIYMQYYLGGVKGLDQNIGRFMDYLDEHGLRKNTIVVYSSDQGFLLGEKGLFDKRWMYDPSMQMPLIVSLPGQFSQGSVNDNIIMNIDFAPSILQMAGLAVPDDMQGQSWVPLLQGEEVDWRNSMYYRVYVNEYNVPPQYGIRTEDYKLIHFDGAGAPLNSNKEAVEYDLWELFDLKVDPDELQNMYNDPEYDHVVIELKTELDRLIKYYNGQTEP